MSAQAIKTLQRRVESALSSYGLLLESDELLPSVVKLVAGEALRGSWFEHPRGRDVFETVRALNAHPDSMQTRLVSGQVTYVHRNFWPYLASVGTAREAWQREGLDAQALGLLERVNAAGEYSFEDQEEARALAPVVRALEERMALVGELREEGSRPVKWLRSWDHWVEDVGNGGGLGARPTPERARKLLGVVLDELNGEFGAAGRFPWEAGA